MRTRFSTFGPVLVLLALAAAACQSESTAPAGETNASQMPADQVVYGLRTVMTQEGVRTGELFGDTAYLHETSRRLDLTGVNLKFFTDTGVQSGTLTSTTGEYDLESGSFVARGNVVLITQTPQGERRLETEELHYDVQANRMWSDKPWVLREADGSTSRGDTFRSDPEFRNWEVTGAQTEGGIRGGASDLSF